MGQAELFESELVIRSNFIFYGNAGNPLLAQRLAEECATLWNEPAAMVELEGKIYRVLFQISASYQPDILPEDVFADLDPRNNFFRIEEKAYGNISFVDGIPSNSGYFLLENLYEGSTTVAHEYGHTLGLRHPRELDIRGEGRPGIMYPRGTLVDPPYQYDPAVPAGMKRGTMHPMHRRVKKEDILALRLSHLNFKSGKAVVGDFTNLYHEAFGN